MSATTRLPVIGATLALGAAAGMTAVPAVRKYIEKQIGAGTVSLVWKLALLAVAALNLKNLPGFWHIRVLRGILYQLYFQPTPLQPKNLFSPLITSSYNTPYDTDYNFHKSNSTYFADLDVARAHFVGCLIRTGLARLNRGDEEGLTSETRSHKGKYFVALGAVSCFFQREIPPMAPFEIHTRVLSWDRKWLYTVSHIVKKGTVFPESYALQPWRKARSKRNKSKSTDNKKDDDPTRHIYATSVARYVFKKARLTINPEVVLERSRVLPPRPAGIGLPPRSESAAASTAAPATPAETAYGTGSEFVDVSHPPLTDSVASQVSSRLDRVVSDQTAAASGSKGDDDGDDEWTWEDMERERLRGLRFASHFDKLGGVHNEFRVGEALGEFGDYW